MPYMCRLCHPVLTSLQLLHNICQLQSCNWIDAWLRCCDTIKAQIETGEAYPVTNVSSCESTDTNNSTPLHYFIPQLTFFSPRVRTFSNSERYSWKRDLQNILCTHVQKKMKKQLNDSINSVWLTHKHTDSHLADCRVLAWWSCLL